MIEGSTKDLQHAINANQKKGMTTVPAIGTSAGLQAALGGQVMTWPLIIFRKDKYFVVIDVTQEEATLHGAPNKLTVTVAHQNGLRIFKELISKTEDFAVLDRNLYDYTAYCKKHGLEMFHIA